MVKDAIRCESIAEQRARVPTELLTLVSCIVSLTRSLDFNMAYHLVSDRVPIGWNHLVTPNDMRNSLCAGFHPTTSSVKM